jgi:hypothetical protein
MIDDDMLPSSYLVNVHCIDLEMIDDRYSTFYILSNCTFYPTIFVVKIE